MDWSFKVGDTVIFKDKYGKEKIGRVSGYDEGLTPTCPMIVESLEGRETYHFGPDGRRTRYDLEPSVIIYKRV